MYLTDHLEVFNWYGWTNCNTSLVSYFNSQGAGENRNLGFTILPLHFWHHICFSKENFGYNNVRYSFGIGLFSFFWDRPS